MDRQLYNNNKKFHLFKTRLSLCARNPVHHFFCKNCQPVSLHSRHKVYKLLTTSGQNFGTETKDIEWQFYNNNKKFHLFTTRLLLCARNPVHNLFCHQLSTHVIALPAQSISVVDNIWAKFLHGNKVHGQAIIQQ